jgi:hypothetical protein
VRPLPTAVLTLVLVAVSAIPGVAGAPLRGTIKRSFTATGVNGHVTASFPARAAHIYASFVWQRAPTAGQTLEIDWFGPTGTRIAVWKNKTLATDTAGTRLYSFISSKTIAHRPGQWRVALIVGGIERAAKTFTVARAPKP